MRLAPYQRYHDISRLLTTRHEHACNSHSVTRFARATTTAIKYSAKLPLAIAIICPQDGFL